MSGRIGPGAGHPVEVRRMNPADLDEVARIEMMSFPTPWSRDSFREELALDGGRSRCRVAEAGGSVLGFAVAGFAADEASLYKIAVDPPVRRRGVATRLLEAMLGEARRADLAVVTLELRVSNQAAAALYRRYGFVETGIRRGYYRDSQGIEDARLMELRLRDSDL